jgi:carbonic anhydrase
MNEQAVPLVVAQHATVKFLINENVKLAVILIRLRAQFSDEMLSRTHVHDYSKSFKEGQTLGLSRHLIHHVSDRTINVNTAYYSKLPEH